ncbi:unnamed protein product [Linum trigynum]|uniref:Uncharacterized protein n=1 Tax=Linum trigynum TaxID=586398 RepID=A0AAV2DC45_9ROSI
MNKNPWITKPNVGTDLFFASSYALSKTRWLLALQLHTRACDRSSAVALLAELLELVGGGRDDGGGKQEEEMDVGLRLGINE